MYVADPSLSTRSETLRHQNLDNVLFSDAFCADDAVPVEHNGSCTASFAPLAEQDVQALLDLLRTFTESRATVADGLFAANTVQPSMLFGKCRSDANEDGDAQAFSLPIHAEPVTDIALNNDDIHIIPRLLAATDTEADTEADDSDDDNVLEAEDVIRHYWRGNDIKYL